MVVGALLVSGAFEPLSLSVAAAQEAAEAARAAKLAEAVREEEARLAPIYEIKERCYESHDETEPTPDTTLEGLWTGIYTCGGAHIETVRFIRRGRSLRVVSLSDGTCAPAGATSLLAELPSRPIRTRDLPVSFAGVAFNPVSASTSDGIFARVTLTRAGCLDVQGGGWKILFARGALGPPPAALGSTDADTVASRERDVSPQPRLHGTYTGANGLSVVFYAGKVTVNCKRFSVDSTYRVTMKGKTRVLTIAGAEPAFINLLPNGNVVGHGGVRISGDVLTGTRTNYSHTYDEHLGDNRFRTVDVYERSPVYVTTDDRCELGALEPVD